MILGITGNIASGKSTVAAIFQQLGAAHISADQIARDVVMPGTDCLAKIVAHFGQTIIDKDGKLDRDKLGSIIFADGGQREILNNITHPAIAKESEKRINELVKSKHPLIVYEAPLLFEANAQSRVDIVLTVTVPEQIQLKRLMDRDKLTADEAKKRINSQMSQVEKAKRADYVIENNKGIDHLKREVSALFRILTPPTLPTERN